MSMLYQHIERDGKFGMEWSRNGKILANQNVVMVLLKYLRKL